MSEPPFQPSDSGRSLSPEPTPSGEQVSSPKATLCPPGECNGHYAACTHPSESSFMACPNCIVERAKTGPTFCAQAHPLCATCFPHGPDETCTCNGCWACAGHVIGCTCDIGWDCEHER